MACGFCGVRERVLDATQSTAVKFNSGRLVLAVLRCLVLLPLIL